MRRASVVVFVAVLALGAGSSAQPAGAQERVTPPRGGPAWPEAGLPSVLLRSPGCEDRVETALASSPSVPSQVLTGMTVFEAMNAIVQAHPGYAWTERDNVIEIRPEVSKDGGDLFLGHEVPAVALGTRSGLLEVFQFISRLFGRPAPSLGSVDTRPFDLRFQGGTLVDLLNAAVRAQGEMAWHVTNVRPDRPEDILKDQFYLEMLPAGGGGAGDAFPRRPTQ